MTYVGVSKEWIKNNAACLVCHISTSELVAELCKREGVEDIIVPLGNCITIKRSGAARILVVKE